jgi:hypothetical protein
MTATFRQFLANESRKTKYDYSSVLVELPTRLTDDIISWGFDHLENSDIYTDPKDPTFGREDDCHITVIYGIHTGDLRQVKPVLEREKPFEVTLGSMSLFTTNDKFDVLKIDVYGEDLYRLNRLLRSHLEVTESYHAYVPHVTIAYLKKGRGDQYKANDTFKGERFTVNVLTFSAKSGIKLPVRIGAK